MLVEKEAETMEEMVRRLERELDEEFLHLFPTAAETPVPAEASEQKVPEAATELVKLDIENKQFANSFVDLEVPSLPPDPTIHTREDGVVKVEEHSKWGQKPGIVNNYYGAIGSRTRGLPSDETKQRPPEIEPAVCPPPDRDRYKWYGYEFKGCRKHQLKGCHRRRVSQTKSAMGALDIGYLCPRPRVRGRIPIEVWCPPTGPQRARRHGRSAFGRPAQ